MSRLVQVLLLVAVVAGLRAEVLPVTRYTVMARVESIESSSANGPGRFSLAAPYGSDESIVATIVLPESLAGREIAIPFESKRSGKERLVQRGTIFRFEYHANLADLRSRTDAIYRRAIPFPVMGIIALKPDGEVAEVYEGVWSSRVAADQRKKTAATP